MFGVAWKISGFYSSRKDLELINPDRVKTWRDMPTYILVLWKTGDEKRKYWEPRSMLRDSWEWLE